MLSNIEDSRRIDLLRAFAARVRRGDYSRRKGGNAQVRCGTVQVALRAIGAKFELDGKPNPTYRAEGKYWLAIQEQLEGYRRQDPPACPKLAIPVSVVNHLIDAAAVSQTPKAQATADLCLIAFYFLLRVGEYTHHGSKDRRRTQQFRASDVKFFDAKHTLIPNTSSLEKLLQAHSVTLTIDNQKNGVRGGTINHEAIHNSRCPLRAVARRVHHILSNRKGRKSHILSTYFDQKGNTKSITSTHINTALKNTVRAIGLDKQGFSPRQVSSHSLRAGGAMALHLNGANSDTIRKMGRWSSDTFLMYIHEQVSAFSAGLASKMSREIGWHNIATPHLGGGLEDI